uniref:DUF4781 domain-containing protein n=1 Tax=Glossina morsitans morsitans TaxID=37546 RepID=A0A1B0GE66_GLOMM
MNVTSIVLSGSGLANGNLDLILDVMQLAASLVLLTHSVYNFPMAAKIVEDSRSRYTNNCRNSLKNYLRSAFLGQHLLSVVLVDLSSLNPTIDDKIQDKLYDSSQLQDKKLVKILGFPWGAYATALKSIIKITAPSSGGSSGSTAFASHNALICECFIIVSVKTASTNQTGLPTGAVIIFWGVVSQKSSFEVANLVRTMLLAVI